MFKRFRLSPLLCLAFTAGIGGVQLMPQLPSLSPLVLAFMALAAAAWRLPAARHWLLLLMVVAAGASYATWRAQLRLAAPLPPALIWQDITVEGVVGHFPTSDDRRSRFDFLIDRVITAQATLTLQVQARINDYHRQAPPAEAIAAGNRLRFSARLRPPTSSVNPHGFDYAGYLFTHNIRLVGYVRNRDDITLLADGSGSWRRQLYERINASQAPQSALIAALVIGDRSHLTDEQWQVLQNTGTAHLVSVSGVHIGLIFLMAAVMLGGLWRRHQRLTAILPTLPAATLLALPVALSYALLAGFAVPVQRSFFMAAAAAAALFLGGVGSVFAALGLALLIVVLMDPWAVLAPGFWLSFLLTAAVLAAMQSKRRDSPLWWRLIGIQLMLSLVAVPLTLWFFNKASVISPLANLLAVPLVGFVAVPLSLAGIFAGEWCWHLAGELLDILWGCLQWLAQLPYAVVTPAAPPLWLFLLAMAGGIWLLLPPAVPWRTAGILPLIAMLLWQPPALPTGAVRMSVLDVGQGTAVVLQTKQHVVVYDTGRDFGGIIVTDYLRGAGIRRIDKLIISHDDYDHRGGMARLLDNIATDTVIASDGDVQCEHGMQWQYDEVAFRILHPPAGNPLAQSSNDISCVLLVQSAGGKRALLTGDISATVEQRLSTRADVLLVAHHGSRHSSDQRFLRTVNAAVAVIAVGRNEYGHPHPQTIERLKSTGTAIYRTDSDGAVIINIADTVEPRRWRDVSKRYWR